MIRNRWKGSAALGHQVVVGVEAAVEVERPQLLLPEQEGDDELDVGAGGVVGVVAGVHHHQGLGAEGEAVGVGRAQSGTSVW